MDSNTVLIIGGGLGLLLLVVGFGMSIFGERSVVEERLGRYTEAGQVITTTAGEKKEKGPSFFTDMFDKMGEGTDMFDNISKNLARADIKLRPAEYIAAIVLSSILVALVGFVISQFSLIFAILAAVVGAYLPSMYVKTAQKTRLKKFDNQLGDMLNLMVNGLRAGFSTLQAMEAVSRELPTPICDDFRRCSLVSRWTKRSSTCCDESIVRT
jgi:tight adherence protein B